MKNRSWAVENAAGFLEVGEDEHESKKTVMLICSSSMACFTSKSLKGFRC